MMALPFNQANLKIKPLHLERLALIYVRQSTLLQVRQNTGSTTRQYDLVQRAVELGWPREQIEVIDQDQGCSGASSLKRDGFQWLVAQVGLGQVGAVLSLEASRLARSCSDWYRLLEICALSDTLVIDEEGIYDPGQYKDRLLLGFKGTMSEAELHWIHQRMLGGQWAKAQKAQLRFRLPIGLVHNPAGRIVLDPDQQVQEVVRLVFALFEQYGTALAVVRYFNKQHLLFPVRKFGKLADGELVFKPLRQSKVISLLRNPFYAGAYVYGQTKLVKASVNGTQPIVGLKRRLHLTKMQDWPVVIKDNHPAYITWEEFVGHQQQLSDNRTSAKVGPHPRGAVREGAGLLQGIVLCGKCGRRMSLSYPQGKGLPYYTCSQAYVQFSLPYCQTIRGDEVDAVVAASFLEALKPAQLEVALATLEELETQAQQIQRQWQLRLERNRYEVELARRRFVAVEPENRLVARSLERDWNEKLAELAQSEQEYAAQGQPKLPDLSLEEREQVLTLASDVPAIWHSPEITQIERKQLLRFVIRTVTLTKQEHTIAIEICWQTGAQTHLEVRRPPLSCDKHRTDPKVIKRIEELALCYPDREIAHQLNEAGFVTGWGEAWDKEKVKWHRYKNHIVLHCPEIRTKTVRSGQRGDGRYSVRGVAELLNVHVSTVSDWCKKGRLEWTRATPSSPYWIKLCEEQVRQLSNAAPVAQLEDKS